MKIKSNFAGNLRLSDGSDLIVLTHGDVKEFDAKEQAKYAGQINRHLEAGRLEIVDSIKETPVQSNKEESEENDIEAVIETETESNSDRIVEIKATLRKLQGEFKKTKSADLKKDIKAKVIALKKELADISK
jgi:hypothetical protein